MNQLPGLKKKFLTYKDFGNAVFQQLFTTDQMKDAYTLHANNFKSVFIKNMGKGKFSMQPLPVAAQLAPLYGMQAGDFDNDGNLDVVMTGNDFGNEVTNGQYDAFNGLLMTGDGNGNFTTLPAITSGINIPCDGKALIQLKASGDNYLLAASQNKGPLKIFRNSKPVKKIISFNADDRFAYITLSNGATRKEEIYHGSSFLSQSSQFIVVNDKMKKIVIVNGSGMKREISL